MIDRLIDNNESGVAAAAVVARDAAVRAMRERGIDNASELIAFAEPAAILRACAWFDQNKHRGTTPGALAKLVREGGLPEQVAGRRFLNEEEYGDRIRRWLVEKLPDVCRADERVVEWTRRLYGDVEANRLAVSPEPHPAAVATVIRLHARHGKGRLTVREHGAEIRAAVRAFDDAATADCELIAGKRDQAAISTGTGEEKG